MVIRAVSKNENGEFSEVITKTYFITNDTLFKYQDLTIISFVTDLKNLFNPDKGIYVTGTMYQKIKNNYDRKDSFTPWITIKMCNFGMKGKEWEREAFITIFDKNEINVQQNVGIRIKGDFSRNFPGKSFNLYARIWKINNRN